MVSAGFLDPVVQVGRELRLELGEFFRASEISRLSRRRDAGEPPMLSELRVDDAEIIARRKADALLRAVRYGAVRR